MDLPQTKKVLNCTIKNLDKNLYTYYIKYIIKVFLCALNVALIICVGGRQCFQRFMVT
jgi:hypothetical protein